MWFNAPFSFQANPEGKIGDPIHPFMDGTVTYAGEIWWGYGKHIIIDHGNNITSLYGHKEVDFEKILGKGNALRTLGIGTAVAFGGFFSEISYNFALIVSATSILTISVIAFLWPEIKPITSTGEEGYWSFLKNSFYIWIYC